MARRLHIVLVLKMKPLEIQTMIADLENRFQIVTLYVSDCCGEYCNDSSDCCPRCGEHCEIITEEYANATA